MVRCRKCFGIYNESIAAGVCPHCGYYEGYQQDDPRYLPIGTILNKRYYVGGVIGVGGFGITYKVWDAKHNVCKAIKEYFQQGVVNRVPGTKEVLISARKRLEEFEYGKRRLLDEARIVAKFQSASIVKVDDFFEENNTSYMVMEYLESQTLEDYINQRKRVLDSTEAINLGVKVCQALDEIHKAGVIHRDISPDNLFVDENGNVKIIDFGSARLSKEDTDDRLIMIKPGFAPPEQYERIDTKHDRQQGWVDIYALGATIYCAMTGVTPAESTDRKADFDNDVDRVCYPKEINASIPDFLNNVIMTAMAINIHERFQTAKEFEEALNQERQVLPVEVVRKRKKMKRRVGISGGLVVAACFLGIFAYRWIGDMDDVRLDSANIAVWYSISDENAMAKNAAMENIIAEVNENNVFAQIDIELIPIHESEYEVVLTEAYASNEMPEVFECVNRNAEYMKNTLNLSGVVDNLDSGSCYFMDDYEDTNQIPTGFNLPIIYINKLAVSDYSEDMDITSMGDLMQLCDGELKYKPMAMNAALKENYSEMFADFSDYEGLLTMTDSSKSFCEGEMAVYFSDTSDYFDIHESMPGVYAMIPIRTEKVICLPCNSWSISTSTVEEQAASEKLLEVFMENNAQQIFYVQNNVTDVTEDYKPISGFPIEKGAVSAYFDVRPKFEDIVNDFDIYTLDIQ